MIHGVEIGREKSYRGRKVIEVTCLFEPNKNIGFPFRSMNQMTTDHHRRTPFTNQPLPSPTPHPSPPSKQHPLHKSTPRRHPMAAAHSPPPTTSLALNSIMPLYLHKFSKQQINCQPITFIITFWSTNKLLQQSTYIDTLKSLYLHMFLHMFFLTLIKEGLFNC